jgi:hypothetical protein
MRADMLYLVGLGNIRQDNRIDSRYTHDIFAAIPTFNTASSINAWLCLDKLDQKLLFRDVDCERAS